MRTFIISSGHSDVKDRGVKIARPSGAVWEGDEMRVLRNMVANRMGRDPRFDPATMQIKMDGKFAENNTLTQAIGVLREHADSTVAAVELHVNSWPERRSGTLAISGATDRTRATDLATRAAKAAGLPLSAGSGWLSDGQSQHHRLAFVKAGGIILETCFTYDFEKFMISRNVVCQAIIDWYFNQLKGNK